MNSLKQKLIVIYLFVFAMISFYSCVPKEPIDIVYTEAEIWQLQMIGDAKGKLKMMLKRAEIEKDIYSIAGKFSGKMEHPRGVIGQVKFELKGKIEKNIFLADFSGYADMLEAKVLVNGTMKGTVSESQGSGTWSATYPEGLSAGKWTMKKIRPPQ